MRRLLASTRDAGFAPRSRALDAAWDPRRADDVRGSVRHTIDLYASGRLRYPRLAAIRR